MICVWLELLVAMFWNVENFFDPFDDPLKNDDEFTAVAARHWTWARFEHKRDGLAQTIVAAADVWGTLPALVGLAEVENTLVVSQLVRKTLLEELDYGYIHRESPDERGIDVALLYRKDLLRVVAVDSLRVPGFATRDILYVTLRDKRSGAVDVPLPEHLSARATEHQSAAERGRLPDEGFLHVFVVHLPSKRGGARASDSRREAALGVLQTAVDSLRARDAGCRILVMGDFNDEDCAVGGLAEPTPEAGPDTPGTLKYHGRWERIDHFFLSSSLKGRAKIFAPPFLLEKDAAYLGVKPRRTFVGPRHNGGLSDHLPIMLKIEANGEKIR